MGTTTPLAVSNEDLGGSGVTPVGPRPVINKTGTLQAHIGDTFTLSFSENLAGQTIAPFLGSDLNNVGWVVDANLDASIGETACDHARHPDVRQWGRWCRLRLHD